MAVAVLNEAELEKLQTTLVGQMQQAGCLPLDVAHGLLTATAADPRVDELLDHALGGLAGDAELRSLLARFREQLLGELERAEYGPLILQMPRDDGTSLPLPYGWCQGYAAGLEFIGEDKRDALFADQQAGMLLTPILSFLMYEREQWFAPPNEQAHRDTVDELGDAAVGLYNWWRRPPA